MTLPRIRRLLRRAGLPWLAALALLWPLAQTAASWHAVSHLATAASAPDGDDGTRTGLHAASCDLCLGAAAIGAGGLPGAPAAPVPTDAGHVRPEATHTASRAARCAAAYRSRAPPFTSA